MEDVAAKLEQLEQKVDHIERMMVVSRRWALIRFFVLTILPIVLVALFAVPAMQKIQSMLNPLLPVAGNARPASLGGLDVPSLCKQFCR